LRPAATTRRPLWYECFAHSISELILPADRCGRCGGVVERPLGFCTELPQCCLSVRLQIRGDGEILSQVVSSQVSHFPAQFYFYILTTSSGCKFEPICLCIMAIGSIYMKGKRLLIVNHVCVSVAFRWPTFGRQICLQGMGVLLLRWPRKRMLLWLTRCGGLLRSTEVLQPSEALAFMLIVRTYFLPRLFKRPSMMQICREVIFLLLLLQLDQDWVYALEVWMYLFRSLGCWNVCSLNTIYSKRLACSISDPTAEFSTASTAGDLFPIYYSSNSNVHMNTWSKFQMSWIWSD
jgi:hypothetical protein